MGCWPAPRLQAGPGRVPLRSSRISCPGFDLLNLCCGVASEPNLFFAPELNKQHCWHWKPCLWLFLGFLLSEPSSPLLLQHSWQHSSQMWTVSFAGIIPKGISIAYNSPKDIRDIHVMLGKTSVYSGVTTMIRFHGSQLSPSSLCSSPDPDFLDANRESISIW